MNVRKVFVGSILAACAFGVNAAPQVLTCGSGSEGGTYDKFVLNMKQVCDSDTLQINVQRTGGGNENIDFMIGAKTPRTDCGMSQMDTLQAKAGDDPNRVTQNAIKVLMPLYPEEVHVFAAKNLSKTSGGFNVAGTNFLGSKVVLNNLDDLEKVKVGAWGGSVTTAEYIALKGKVKYEVVPMKDAKEAKAALDAGQIAAILAVGGQPLGFATSLNGNYKLLEISPALASAVKAYTPTSLNYDNLNAKNVQTVATRSVLLVRDYESPARRAAISELKACVQKNFVELKEGGDFHPKWAEVDLKADVNWPMFVVNPTVAPVAEPAAKAKKK